MKWVTYVMQWIVHIFWVYAYECVRENVKIWFKKKQAMKMVILFRVALFDNVSRFGFFLFCWVFFLHWTYIRSIAYLMLYLLNSIWILFLYSLKETEKWKSFISISGVCIKTVWFNKWLKFILKTSRITSPKIPYDDFSRNKSLNRYVILPNNFNK